MDDDEPFNIRLIRLGKKTTNYETFYEINKLNSFHFYRTDDLLFKKFSFMKYEAFHPETKTRFHIISNRSFPKRKNTAHELFSQTEEIKFLLSKHKHAEYVIFAKDSFPDFSLILLPEHLYFHVEDIAVLPQQELYKLLQYYE